MAVDKRKVLITIEDVDAQIIEVCAVRGAVPMYTYTHEVLPYLMRLIDMRVRMAARTHVVLTTHEFVVDLTVHDNTVIV